MFLYLQALQVLPSPPAVLVNPTGNKNIQHAIVNFGLKNNIFSACIVSLDSHYVLLVPVDQRLLGRLSNPGT